MQLIKGEPPNGLEGSPPVVGGYTRYHTTAGRREARIFDLSTSAGNHTSPFHIPTDIVVTDNPCARYNIAKCTKLKYTFDFEIHTVQVLHRTVGPWAARINMTLWISQFHIWKRLRWWGVGIGGSFEGVWW